MGILINQGRQIGGLSEQDQANIGKVTQTVSDSSDYEYELLFSESADNTTHTEEARKSQYFKFNPNIKALTVGTRKRLDDWGVTIEKGDYSSTFGYNLVAPSMYSYAEGNGSHAGGAGAHAEGCYTIAWGDYQHVQGKYNVKDTNLIYAHIVGNGTSNTRSNAYALRWNGQQDVTNDIVRVDSGGTWDGFNASLEDAFKQNLGECCNYEEVEGVTRNYQYYKIAEIEVNPGTVEDNYERQYDISNPLVFEVSQIVADATWGSATGYSVLYMAFKLNTTTNETEILQFKTSNSMDFKLIKDSNNSNIWILYGIYRSITQQTPLIKNKSVLHRITGSGFNNNVTVVMQNVESTGTGQFPDRDCIKSSGDIIHGPIIFGAPRWNVQTDRTCDIQFQSDLVGTWDGEETSLKAAVWDCAKRGQITGEYSALSTYAVGDFCIYLNTLYICNTAISTPEDFDSTHWTATTIENSFVKKSGDTMTGTLIGKANSTIGTWKLGRDNASFKKTDVSNVSAFYPVLSVKGYTYDWSIGTLGNDSNSKLYFVRTFDSDYSGTGNKTQKFGLYGGSSGADSEYVIAHSGNVGTGDSNGKVKIAGVNVAVKGLGSRAYDSTAYLPLAGGTCTGDVYFKKKIDVTNWSNFRGGLWTTSLSVEGGVEIGYSTPYIDFHYNKDTHDYTHRLICSSVGNWDFLSKNTASTQAWVSTILNAEQFKVRSSIHIKENIKDIEEDEALKLLELRPVSFDYKDRADGKDQRGLIAEEVMDILPNTVLIPEGYTEFDPKNPNNVPGIDYSKFVPYLIKLCQIQQNQINTLTEKLDNLNKN